MALAERRRKARRFIASLPHSGARLKRWGGSREQHRFGGGCACVLGYRNRMGTTNFREGLTPPEGQRTSHQNRTGGSASGNPLSRLVYSTHTPHFDKNSIESTDRLSSHFSPLPRPIHCCFRHMSPILCGHTWAHPVQSYPPTHRTPVRGPIVEKAFPAETDFKKTTT